MIFSATEHVFGSARIRAAGHRGPFGNLGANRMPALDAFSMLSITHRSRPAGYPLLDTHSMIIRAFSVPARDSSKAWFNSCDRW